jgi:WD40 repeat protein
MLTSCRFAGDSLVAGSFDGKVHRWNVDSGERTEIGSHPTWVTSVVPGPSDRLYTADLQGNLKAWDLAANNPLWSIDAAHPGWLRALALSPDGTLLASGARDAVVRLWNTSDGKLVRELKGHGRDIYSAAFHPDGTSLATGDYDGKILHWDVAAGKLLRTLDAGGLTTRNSEFLCDVGGVRALAFDATGERLAASGLRDAKSNTFCPGVPAGIVFDWAAGKEALKLKLKEGSIDGAMTSVRYLPDGSLAGCGEGAGAGALWLWKPGESEPGQTVSGQSAYEVDVRADGQAVAIACFEPIGPGGNGNGKALKKGEVVTNGGRLRLYSLQEKPAKK